MPDIVKIEVGAADRKSGELTVRMSFNSFLNLRKACPACRKFLPLSAFGLRRMTDAETFLRNQSWCEACRKLPPKVKQ